MNPGLCQRNEKRLSYRRILDPENPIGFSLSPLRCSWQIQDTDAAALRYLKIEVASDPQFAAVLLEKEGAALDPCGTVLPLALSTCCTGKTNCR